MGVFFGDANNNNNNNNKPSFLGPLWTSLGRTTFCTNDQQPLLNTSPSSSITSNSTMSPANSKLYGTAASSCSAASTCSITSESETTSDAGSVTAASDNDNDHSTTTFARKQQPSSSSSSSSSHTLGIFQFATIIFYSVSGGPFGIEESVRAAGPFWTLVGFIVAPFVFSIPECLMTCELSACESFQSSAAGCAWVEEAFGSGAGFVTGYWNWLSGATDNAIYPVLFLEYALKMFPNDQLEELHSTARCALITSIAVGLAYLNWLGLDLVGNMSMVVCCVAMSPFVIFVILGASQVDPQRWFRLPSDHDSYYYFNSEVTTSNITMSADDAVSDDDVTSFAGGFLPNIVLGGVFLRPLVNNLFWNYNSFDNAGSFAEDIQNPVHVLPRGMFLGFAMTVLGYILPLLVALGTTDAAPEEWVDGYLATVVSDTVGPWLGKWLVFAAALSNVGMFQAELSSDAFLLMGMADRGHLPAFLAHRSPTTGTPTYALLVGTFVIVVMGVSNLDDLIEMLNFNYALALIMEYAAFIKLRISQPDVPRPFRVPLSTRGCVIALIPTIAALSMVIILASYRTIVINILTTAAGAAIYALMQRKNASTGGSSSSSAPKDYEFVQGNGDDDDDDNEEELTVV